MLFSGHHVERTCAGCGYRAARSSPTSILFFIVLVAAASTVLVPQLKEVYGFRWWYVPVVPLGEIVLLLAILAFLDWLNQKIFPLPSQCPRCAQGMESTFSGFYDFGCVPTLIEILLVVALVGVHILIIKLIA